MDASETSVMYAASSVGHELIISPLRFRYPVYFFFFLLLLLFFGRRIPSIKIVVWAQNIYALVNVRTLTLQGHIWQRDKDEKFLSFSCLAEGEKIVIEFFIRLVGILCDVKCFKERRRK